MLSTPVWAYNPNWEKSDHPVILRTVESIADLPLPDGPMPVGIDGGFGFAPRFFWEPPGELGAAIFRK